MRKTIIIPIYLKFNQPDELPNLEGWKFARRAIESLRILEDQDFTLILPVCFDPIEADEEASFPEIDRLLRKELRNLNLQRAFVFSSRDLPRLRRYLEQRDFGNFYSLIDLKGYPKIRNTGLLLAQALLMDAAIFIDSDEVIEDPRYLKIACEYLNQEWNGRVVSGKGGFYVNLDDTILLPSQRLWWRFLWNKTKWMNRVWENILSSKERLIESPVLLGGNLVLLRDLFSSVPFDPYIPRGEDTDYLINASQLGFSIFFDKELKIKHLHPERTKIYFHGELKGDIERFSYERKKIRRTLRINLNPYPGCFLKWTLYPRAILTTLLLSLDYLGRREWKSAKECVANFSLIFQERGEGWSKYLKFREDWEKVMEHIHKEGMDGLLGSCWI